VLSTEKTAILSSILGFIVTVTVLVSLGYATTSTDSTWQPLTLGGGLPAGLLLFLGSTILAFRFLDRHKHNIAFAVLPLLLIVGAVVIMLMDYANGLVGTV